MAQANMLMGWSRFGIIHTAQPIISVNFRVDVTGRLTHPGRRELPVVSRIERRSVKNEDGDFCRPSPIVVLRRKFGLFPFRLYREFVQPAGSVAKSVGDLRIDLA